MAGEALVQRQGVVLPSWVAAEVIRNLEARDASLGGVWAASVGLWERYDVPWNGHWGARGTAQVVGSIAAVYGLPARGDITIERVLLTPYGVAAGWTHDALLNEALRYGRVTLAQLPRARSSEARVPLRVAALELVRS